MSLSGADAAWIQGRPYESLLSYIPRSEWAAIRAGTSTLDVSSYIQAAINDGLPLVVPPGTYSIANAIKVRTNTAIRAMGAAGSAVFKAKSTMTAAVMVDTNDLSDGTGVYAQSNVLIDGITFDGQSRTISTHSVLVRLSSISGLTLRNCVFKNQLYGLVAIGGCHDVVVENCEFTSWGLPAVSAEGGPALWIAGNVVGGDDTPSTKVRLDNLHFHDSEWAAIYDFAVESSLSNILITDVKECGIFSINTNGGVVSADNEALRHVYSNITINGVRLKNISADGMEIACQNIAVTNCNITDCDDAGIKLKRRVSNAIVSNCNIWDCVKDPTTYPNTGQIAIAQMDGIDNDNITIVNNRIGMIGVTPLAKYAISFYNDNGAGHVLTNLTVTGNNVVNGYVTDVFRQVGTPISATDTVSAICNNTGAADLYNPAILNMALSGRQLTTAYMLP